MAPGREESKLHICCLSRITLAHAAKGGMEVHIKTLSEGLARSGHKVKIITTAHPHGLAYEKNQSIETFYCKGTACGQYTRDWGRRSLDLLRTLHKADPFDIIWGEGGGGYYYIRSARSVLKIPAVTILQGSFLANMRSQLSEMRSNRNLALLFLRQFPGRAMQYLTRDLIFAGRADAVIGSSPECAQDARREYFLGKDRIYASVNGVDVQRFAPKKSKPSGLRRQIGIKSNGPIILTASRLIRGKGVHILIQALPAVLEAVPDAVLLVAGLGLSLIHI